MPTFPDNPRLGQTEIAWDFGSLLFVYDGRRWVADAADVLTAFERMASDRERLARERCIKVFERVYGRPFPDDLTKELGT